MFAFSTFLCYTIFAVGDIAQLEERLNGIQRGSGSIPLISTKTKRTSKRRLFCFGGGRFGGEASGSMAEGHTEGEARSIPLISTTCPPWFFLQVHPCHPMRTDERVQAKTMVASLRQQQKLFHWYLCSFLIC